MYLLVVNFPQYEDSFDGRIMLEMVSRAEVLTCDSKNNKNRGIFVYLWGYFKGLLEEFNCWQYNGGQIKISDA